MQLQLLSDKESNKVYVKGSSIKVRIPQMSEDLALFLGLLWGDGWLTNRKSSTNTGSWRIGIVEDDKPLIEEYCTLVERLFGIKPKILDRKTKIEAYFNNRIIYELLNQDFGFPDGEKIGKLRIPNQILTSDELMKHFIKGVFSTDGKFITHGNYPRVGMSTSTKAFIVEIKNFLVKIGINAKINTWKNNRKNNLYGLYINGHNQTRKFKDEIGFIGEKHEKLEIFLN